MSLTEASPAGASNSGDDYYQHLLDSSRFAVIGMDRSGKILSWNKAARMIFNEGAAHVIGQRIESVIPEHLQSVLNEHMERCLESGQPSEFELDLMNDDNQVKFLAMALSPIRDNEGKLHGVSAWVRDITNRKTLEKQLMHAEKMASLGTLAAGVAHHFNNIFGGVATFVDFALESGDPQSTQRALQITADAAGRVGQITRSLLTFAEKDAQTLDLSDLTEVVLTFAHLVENALNEKKINLNLHMQSIPVVEVPGSRMHQVLGNLLDNAEQAMPDGGTIQLSLSQEGRQVVLRFEDNGTGITERDLPHIFEPFYTTRGVSGGGDHPAAGLGLSVVHGIIREINGDIKAENAADHGAIFSIYFPIPDLSLGGEKH